MRGVMQINYRSIFFQLAEGVGGRYMPPSLPCLKLHNGHTDHGICFYDATIVLTISYHIVHRAGYALLFKSSIIFRLLYEEISTFHQRIYQIL